MASSVIHFIDTRNVRILKTDPHPVLYHLLTSFLCSEYNFASPRLFPCPAGIFRNKDLLFKSLTLCSFYSFPLVFSLFLMRVKVMAPTNGCPRFRRGNYQLCHASLYLPHQWFLGTLSFTFHFQSTVSTYQYKEHFTRHLLFNIKMNDKIKERWYHLTTTRSQFRIFSIPFPAF